MRRCASAGRAFDGDHAGAAVAVPDGGGGLVVIGEVPGPGGVEVVELEDHDAVGPLAFPDLALAAADEEAAAVPGQRLGGQRRVFGVALAVLDVDFDDHVGRHWGHGSFRRRTWRGRPRAPIAASARASDRVGWGAMVRARSSVVAPISTASAASAASSATPAPTM